MRSPKKTRRNARVHTGNTPVRPRYYLLVLLLLYHVLLVSQEEKRKIM